MRKGTVGSGHAIFKDERQFSDRAPDMSKQDAAVARAEINRMTETEAARHERKLKRMRRGLVGS